MPITIDLIRHGETRANRDGHWQGRSDSPLTTQGQGQVHRLGRRLGRYRDYDLVVASTLGRARATAAAMATAVETDASWCEADLGRWEGLSRDEVTARYGAELAALHAGRDIPLGGGESLGDVARRADDAFATLVARLDHGDHVAVVTHGGVISALIGGWLGLRGRRRPWPLARLVNTSITTVCVDGDAIRVDTYNDAAHTDTEHLNGSYDGSIVTLVRHGESDGNAAGRWQGLTDGALTARGRSQADRLAGWQTGLGAVYSSPLQRARDTAAAVARHNGISRHEHANLREIAFGAWEDLSPAEIARRWPDAWREIYVDGVDQPRGGDGETWAAAGDRLGEAIAEILGQHPDGGVGIVSHGGALRAYVARFVGMDFARRRRLGELRNTAVTRVALGESGPVLVDYNVAPHLDG